MFRNFWVLEMLRKQRVRKAESVDKHFTEQNICSSLFLDRVVYFGIRGQLVTCINIDFAYYIHVSVLKLKSVV